MLCLLVTTATLDSIVVVTQENLSLVYFERHHMIKKHNARNLGQYLCRHNFNLQNK